MFDYVPDVFKDQYATTERRVTAGTPDADNNRRAGAAGRATRWPGRSTPRSKAVAAHPGRRLPGSVHPDEAERDHQAAAVDAHSSRSWPTSTSQGADAGRPHAHYVMVAEANRTTGASKGPACSPPVSAPADAPGSNRLGDSLSDLLSSGAGPGSAGSTT